MSGNNNAVNESLSALLDNEHSELDLRRVLKAAESDEAVLETWARYQRVSQAMRKEPSVQPAPDFLSGIQQAIADEPQPKVAAPAGRSWARYSGKAAIAACVTFAFLIGATQWNPTGTSAPAPAVAASDARHESMAVVPSGFELPPLTARTVSTVPGSENAAANTMMPRATGAAPARQEVVLSPELQAQLNRLMLKHAETSSANGGLSVIPFTRVGSVQTEGE